MSTWDDILREYDAGWIGGGTAGGMSPIGDNPNLKRNFSTQGRGRGWPYEDEEEGTGDGQTMSAREKEGGPTWAAGSQMRPDVSGQPPTPRLQDTWEGGPDPEHALDAWLPGMPTDPHPQDPQETQWLGKDLGWDEDEQLGGRKDEAMGLPINFGMSGRGGQMYAGEAPAKAGWAHAQSIFGTDEDEVPEPPIVDDDLSVEEAGKMSIWDTIDGLKEAEDFFGGGEESPADEAAEEHEAAETPEHEAKEEEPSDDPGEFQLEPEAIEIEVGEDEPGDPDDPDGDPDDVPMGVGGFFGEETGEEPPDQLGPMNPYPPEAEPVANMGQDYLGDASDDELENQLDRIHGHEDNPGMAMAPSEAPGGSAGIKNPLDLFALPSAWDNVELILRGSKHPTATTAPGPAIPLKK